MNFNDLPKNLSRFGFGDCADFEPLEKTRVMEIVEFVDGKLERQQKINNEHSSYGLKHLLETAMGGYIANGELIAAMYLIGFRVRIDSPNAYFNIAEWTVKHLIKSNK